MHALSRPLLTREQLTGIRPRQGDILVSCQGYEPLIPPHIFPANEITSMRYSASSKYHVDTAMPITAWAAAYWGPAEMLDGRCRHRE